jgi:hypothetical protein
MRVDVRDGIVHSVTPEGESIPLPPSSHEYYPSIRGLFDLIARAIDLPAARLMVRYDEARGFPHEAYIDYRDTIADDEVGYVVGAIRLP